MLFFQFLLQVVLISLSGVMAPGPVTAVTLGKGNGSPHAGALISLGHGAVEFPLMVALFYGFGAILKFPYVKGIIALFGGALILLMGVGMLRDMNRREVRAKGENHSSFMAGVLLSAGNPYFILWWATIGITLIMRSVGFGILGFLIFALVHWLCDFTWLYFLSALSYRGGKFFGRRFQRIIFGVCGILLLFFGGVFIVDATKTFL